MILEKQPCSDVVVGWEALGGELQLWGDDSEQLRSPTLPSAPVCVSWVPEVSFTSTGWDRPGRKAWGQEQECVVCVLK